MLAAITSLFNPVGYDAPLRNYRRFRDSIEAQGVPLFTAELSFDDNFHVADALKVRGRPANLLWQKERLLNLLLDRLPSQYDKVAWVDADVIFLDPDWAERAEDYLEEWAVVQLFWQVNHLDSNGRAFESFGPWDVALTKSEHEAEQAGVGQRKPGYAWAAKRSALKAGFYDRHVTGNGDRLMVDTWQGKTATGASTGMTEAWYKDYLRWSAPSYRAMKANGYVVEGSGVTNLPGEINHLWHGGRAGRQYRDRGRILVEHDFDPSTDITIDSNGLWAWSSLKPELHNAVAQLFFDRNEDELYDATE